MSCLKLCEVLSHLLENMFIRFGTGLNTLEVFWWELILTRLLRVWFLSLSINVGLAIGPNLAGMVLFCLCRFLVGTNSDPLIAGTFFFFCVCVCVSVCQCRFDFKPSSCGYGFVLSLSVFGGN